MHLRHQRNGDPGHQSRAGLPPVGVRVGVGLVGDVERPGVPAPAVADHQGGAHACASLITTSKNAIDKTNEFVQAFNSGRGTGPTEGPAIDALNDSATTVANSFNDAMSQQIKDAFNAYIDAAHSVANAIGTHAGTSEFNKRVDQLNDTKKKAIKLCLAT